MPIIGPTVVAALQGVGFTTGGVAAGSWASSIMSSCAIANGGGVASMANGGIVAACQSAGAVGALSAGSTVAIGAGTLVVAGVAVRSLAASGCGAHAMNTAREVARSDVVTMAKINSFAAANNIAIAAIRAKDISIAAANSIASSDVVTRAKINSIAAASSIASSTTDAVTRAKIDSMAAARSIAGSDVVTRAAVTMAAVTGVTNSGVISQGEGNQIPRGPPSKLQI